MISKNILTAVVLLCLVTVARAEEPKVEVLVDGLNTPAGVAVQPETNVPFFSESGAAVVSKYVDGKKVDVIKGFPMGTYGTNPTYPIGPLGLAFLDPNTIIVGCGGSADGEDDIRVYKWTKVDEKATAALAAATPKTKETASKQTPPQQAEGDLFGKPAPRPVPLERFIPGNARTDNPLDKTQSAKITQTTPEPVTLSDTSEVLDFAKPMAIIGPLAESGSTPGEGNFYGIAVSKGSIIAAANGDDEKGWIVRSIVSPTSTGYRFGTLRRFIATKELVNVDAPAAVTFSPQKEIAVGQMGEITDIRDSLLTFYAQRGKLLANFKTELYDIVGLAYCPKTGLLYAVDFAWAKPEEAGLFRLDAALDENNKPTVKVTKILALDHPTALAFDSDGKLYVTEIGKATKEKPAAGRLLRITLPEKK